MTRSCRKSAAVLIAVLLLLAGCTARPPSSPRPSGEATLRPYTINGSTYYPIASAGGYWERGIASWYGRKFHGRKTACGETYDMYGRTAAHKILPMHTMLLVRNLENGRETVVRVNDRGPFVRGRIVDLSYTAAQEIGLIRNGTAKVEIIALGEAPGSRGRAAPVQAELKHQDFQHGEFYVQVGSFLDQGKAEHIARFFYEQGIKVIIQPYITGNDTYYRVQLFAGTVLEPARLLEQQVLSSGYSGAFLIAR